MKITSSEPKAYFGIPEKGLITSLGIKTMRRSKKIKKAGFAISNVSLKDIYKIIKESLYLPHEGYVSKRSKHVTYYSTYIYQDSVQSA